MMNSIKTLEQNIKKAKDKYQNSEPMFLKEKDFPSKIKYLEANIIQSRKRRYNNEILHMALLGQALENKSTTNLQELGTRDIRAAIYIYKIFKDDVESIWYLEDTSVSLFKEQSASKLTKLTAQFNENEEPLFKRPRRLATLENTDTFEEWMNEWDIPDNGLMGEVDPLTELGIEPLSELDPTAYSLE